MRALAHRAKGKDRSERARVKGESARTAKNNTLAKEEIRDKSSP